MSQAWSIRTAHTWYRYAFNHLASYGTEYFLLEEDAVDLSPISLTTVMHALDRDFLVVDTVDELFVLDLVGYFESEIPQVHRTARL